MTATMKAAIKIKASALALAAMTMFVGCADNEDSAATKPVENDHILQDQVKALEKAKSVEQMLQSGAEQRQQAIEQQTEQ